MINHCDRGIKKHISITKKSDMSVTVIYHGMSLTVLYHLSLKFLVILIQYSQRHTMINHCDRRTCITQILGDTDTAQIQLGLHHILAYTSKLTLRGDKERNFTTKEMI
jgi:hypothetical protein